MRDIEREEEKSVAHQLFDDLRQRERGK